MLVFDMDGVLVEVTESYRETIARTVEHFTGARPTRERIQEYKNAGGWNDDWQLSHHMVREAGVDAAFEDVTAHFQKLFHGDGTDGLILREQWVARPGRAGKTQPAVSVRGVHRPSEMGSRDDAEAVCAGADLRPHRGHG